MSNAHFTTSTTVTATYQSGGRLLCPPPHLFHEPVPQPVFVPQPAPQFPQHPGYPADAFMPGPSQPAPFDGVPPQQIRIGNVGELLIGGIAGAQTHVQFADAIKDLRSNGFTQAGIKNLGMASLKAGGISGGITAAVSAFQNIGAAASGKISGRQAFGNVSADTVGGLLAGTTAGLGAGAASLALSSLGAGGLVLTIGAAAAGALGGIGGNKLYDALGLRRRVYNAAHAFAG